jgi:hypothetical protein
MRGKTSRLRLRKSALTTIRTARQVLPQALSDITGFSINPGSDMLGAVILIPLVEGLLQSTFSRI